LSKSFSKGIELDDAQLDARSVTKFEFSLINQWMQLRLHTVRKVFVVRLPIRINHGLLCHAPHILKDLKQETKHQICKRREVDRVRVLGRDTEGTCEKRASDTKANRTSGVP
jgi:hypothetical protein